MQAPAPVTRAYAALEARAVQAPAPVRPDAALEARAPEPSGVAAPDAVARAESAPRRAETPATGGEIAEVPADCAGRRLSDVAVAAAPERSALLADLEARAAASRAAPSPRADQSAAEREVEEPPQNVEEERAAERKEAVRAACQQVRRDGLDRAALRTIRAYMQNLASCPENPQFRSIRKENRAFAKAVAAMPGAVAIFQAVGFEDRGETLQLDSPDRATLWDALAKVDLLLQLSE